MTTTLNDRIQESPLISILAPILKERGRMRILLMFQACLVLALFTVSLSSGEDKNNWNVPTSTVRIRQESAGAASTESQHQKQRTEETRPDIHRTVNRESHHPALRKGELKPMQYAPNFFTEKAPVEILLARNNLLSVYTGCSIATWTYEWQQNTPRFAQYYDDCGHYNAEKQWTGRDITVETVSEIQPGDSIYVELKNLDYFAQHLLP